MPIRRPTPDIMTAATWALAFSIAVIVSASHLLDGPSDFQAAQDVADEAAYAAAVADGGASKCAALGNLPVWTPEGDLICRLPGRSPAPADQPVTVAQRSTP